MHIRKLGILPVIIIALLAMTSLAAAQGNEIDLSVQNLDVDASSAFQHKPVSGSFNIYNPGPNPADLVWNLSISNPEDSFFSNGVMSQVAPDHSITIGFSFIPESSGNYTASATAGPTNGFDPDYGNNHQSLVFYVTPVGCMPDFDDDGYVGVTDFLELLANWGSSEHQADLNLDGTVDRTDLDMLLNAWGEC